MRPKPEISWTRLSPMLMAALLLWLGGTYPAWAQAPPSLPPPTPSAPPAGPPIPTELHGPSLVFPEGGFPTTLPAPEGGIPATPARAAMVAPYPPPRPPAADYAPPGYEAREIQEAPGAVEYQPFITTPQGMKELYLPPRLPSSNYLLPAVGPHQYADYAPPGYEAREPEEGQVPGVPEFTPITAPVPVAPDDAARFLTRGLAPGSFLVPGTNTSFRLRGFVRLTGLYDFNPVGTPDIFVTNSIPVPQQSGENFNYTARPSRFALESWTPTSFNDWNVHTFIEGDFFNGAGQAAGGGGNPFRLRHAFIDYGYFRVGQQNSVFMDGNTWPMLVDFQGPAGWVNQRRPGARVTLPLADNLYWAGGIEQPFSDITTNGLGRNVQDVPDFATHLRYEADLGHLQVSSLVRSIGYEPTGGEVTRRTAYGLSVGGVIHPWAALAGTNPAREDNPSGLTRSRIIAQYTFGWGIGRYMLDTAGLGLDGQVDPATGGVDTLYASGWLLSYEHWFTEKWLSSVTYSATQVASNGDQPANTYTGARYFAVNLWYVPVRNMSIGTEYLFGQRRNLDGLRGDANRAELMCQYNF